nr:helix-turn-helix domain-containing protein [Pedobacter panaciterrae]
MEITYYKVHPALREYVELIFTMSRDSLGNGYFSQTALPNHDCYLSFEYDTDFGIKKRNSHKVLPFLLTTIIPPQLDCSEIRGTSLKAIIVKFKHTGFFRMFKVPIQLFKNECHNGKDVLNKEFADVYDRMMTTDSLSAKLKFVEGFLLKKVPNADPYRSIDYAVESLLFGCGNTPIENLASNACMSIRQLERKFIERLGLSPKQYSKFIRFTNAHRMKSLFPDISWGDIAIRCGYFDQMHMIHDFKSIAACNPRQFHIDISNSNILLFPTNVPPHQNI